MAKALGSISKARTTTITVCAFTKLVFPSETLMIAAMLGCRRLSIFLSCQPHLRSYPKPCCLPIGYGATTLDFCGCKVDFQTGASHSGKVWIFLKQFRALVVVVLIEPGPIDDGKSGFRQKCSEDCDEKL